MNTEIIDNYTLSKTREEKLWECALFVFDSSALLDFYNIPKSTRYEIYDNIFKKLPERLWIPFHVQYEYIKNRHNVITKTIAEKYDPLKKDIKDITNLIEREIPKKMEDIINKTKKKDNHPYLEQEFLHSFKKTIDDFIEDTQNFKKIAI